MPIRFTDGGLPAPQASGGPRNPIDNVSRLHKPKRTPEALTPAQVNAIRAAIKVWEGRPA